MNKIKTIIVDDELEAREGIKLLLENDAEIDLLGTCKNGIEAIDMINDHEIDLVFLDIQMPVIDGFEVVKSIPKDRLPHIVFVTAYDQFALKAFDVHAVDYILKPFTNARFTEGLARAKQLITGQKTQQEQEKLKSIVDQLALRSNAQDQLIITSDPGDDQSRLIVKEKGQVNFILLKNIMWLEAFDYYVKVHVRDQFHLIRESMKKLELRLPSSQFLRIHKSSIINREYIHRIETTPNSEYRIILTDKTVLKVSRSYRDAVKNISS